MTSSAVASGYVSDVSGLLEFLGHTFFAFQYGTADVERVVRRILDFLEHEEMIRAQDNLLLATPFGERVSRLYIDPLSAVVIRDGIKGVAKEPPTELGLLHLICHTPDMGLLHLRQDDYADLELFYLERAEELLTPIPDPQRQPEKFESLLSELKTAQMLQMWMSEAREESIHERFSVDAGDIRRLADTAKWLLYASHELASLFKARPALTPLRKLEERVRHGIREELLELVQLRGIGRVRGRSLFNSGYRKLADIGRAAEAELARVPYVGVETARSIKRQVDEGLGEATENV